MSSHPVRVLVADDDEWFREGIKRFLRDTADLLIVAEAGNGRDTLVALTQTQVDVILCDLSMPVIDGLGVLRAVGKMTKQPRVVAVTAFDTSTSLVEALSLGAVGYVSKSDPPSLIVETLRRAGHHEGPHVAPRHVKRLVDIAGGQTDRTPEHPAIQLLTPRENEVFELVIRGLSNAEIANRLNYSEITIRKRVSRILAKFELPSRSRLIAMMSE